jgi:DNA invertase Pin-like site-specific DNA recombinase
VSPKSWRNLRIVEDLERSGVGLIMLSMGGQQIDTHAPTEKLMITMLAAIAQLERDLLLERQREGIAKAKADEKYRGRKSSSDRSPARRPRHLEGHIKGCPA